MAALVAFPFSKCFRFLPASTYVRVPQGLHFALLLLLLGQYWHDGVVLLWQGRLVSLDWQFSVIMCKCSHVAWNSDRAFRTSESESADFSEVRGLGLWKHFGLGLGLSVFVCLRIYTVNISQKNSEFSIFSFLKSYYSLYKPLAQISTIVKTS
jgi:hypothetical protein